MLPRPAESLRSSVVESVSPGCRSWTASYRLLQCSRPHRRRTIKLKGHPARGRDALRAEYGTAAPPHGWLALLGMRGKMIRDGRATRVGQAAPPTPCRNAISLPA